MPLSKLKSPFFAQFLDPHAPQFLSFWPWRDTCQTIIKEILNLELHNVNGLLRALGILQITPTIMSENDGRQ